MTENSNTKFEIGLNIHLVAFNLPKNVIKDHEEIRVSITTMPEEKKQHFHMQAKKMKSSNHVFSINITNHTEKIIMVFRKKSFIYNDPIIASTIIHQSDFPTLPPGLHSFNCNPISTDIKTLDIYYPLQKQIREMKEHGNNNGKFPTQPTDKSAKINRKILGSMQVQLTFTTPYPDLESANEKFRKTHKLGISNKQAHTHGSETKNEYERIPSENSKCNF